MDFGFYNMDCMEGMKQFPDKYFDLAIVDPPHLTSISETAWMCKKYGRLDKSNWPSVIRDGFNECMRVLKTHGTLIFKWNETDIPTREVIKVIGWQTNKGIMRG